MRGEEQKKPGSTDNTGGITPACAGKSPRASHDRAQRGNYPRLRGEEASTSPPIMPGRELPPLARGRGQAHRPFSRASGITPACAGKRTSAAHTIPARRNYPRLRGEEADFAPAAGARRELPPLARGRAARARWLKLLPGITPACAGKRRDSRGCGYKEWNYPRLRGEEIFAALVSMLLRELPPLARGRVRGRATKRRAKGITPACAGKRRRRHRGHARARNYPRLRGEELAA